MNICVRPVGITGCCLGPGALGCEQFGILVDLGGKSFY